MTFQTGSLMGLTRAIEGESRCINAENPTGEKGRAAMSSGPLGPSRKGSPCLRNILPGETKVLADIEGPGILTHIWIITVQERLRKKRRRKIWRDIRARRYT